MARKIKCQRDHKANSNFMITHWWRFYIFNAYKLRHCKTNYLHQMIQFLQIYICIYKYDNMLSTMHEILSCIVTLAP